MGWMSGGDKHTGWKDAKTGKPMTDKQARAAVDKADKQYAAGATWTSVAARRSTGSYGR